MELHQFVHALSYGDAISDEALLIQRLLRAHGVTSEIYCVHVHEKFKGMTRPGRQFNEDLALAQGAGKQVSVLLHYSIACPMNDVFLNAQGIGKALIYHNLTPVEWYARYNARVADNLRKGRAELPTMLKHIDVALADSTFNLGELVEMGCDSGYVLPLGLDRDKWSVAANPGIAGVLKAHGGTNILHVGRFAPNKCIDDVIKAFYFYHHKINDQSKLWLVGNYVDNELYVFELRRLVTELRLKEAVEFVGPVANTELRSFFECSDVYLCMSEHEGFCVPLIEAMHFGVPLIACGDGAIPETLGDAGVMVSSKDPAKIAELIDILATDQAVRTTLIERGRARVLDFSEEQFAQKLFERLLGPLEQAMRDKFEAPVRAVAE